MPDTKATPPSSSTSSQPQQTPSLVEAVSTLDGAPTEAPSSSLPNSQSDENPHDVDQMGGYDLDDPLLQASLDSVKEDHDAAAGGVSSREEDNDDDEKEEAKMELLRQVMLLQDMSESALRTIANAFAIVSDSHSRVHERLAMFKNRSSGVKGKAYFQTSPESLIMAKVVVETSVETLSPSASCSTTNKKKETSPETPTTVTPAQQQQQLSSSLYRGFHIPNNGTIVTSLRKDFASVIFGDELAFPSEERSKSENDTKTKNTKTKKSKLNSPAQPPAGRQYEWITSPIPMVATTISTSAAALASMAQRSVATPSPAAPPTTAVHLLFPRRFTIKAPRGRPLGIVFEQQHTQNAKRTANTLLEVEGTVPNSPAELAGFPRKGFVVAVNGIPVRDAATGLEMLINLTKERRGEGTPTAVGDHQSITLDIMPPSVQPLHVESAKVVQFPPKEETSPLRSEPEEEKNISKSTQKCESVPRGENTSEIMVDSPLLKALTSLCGHLTAVPPPSAQQLPSPNVPEKKQKTSFEKQLDGVFAPERIATKSRDLNTTSDHAASLLTLVIEYDGADSADCLRPPIMMPVTRIDNASSAGLLPINFTHESVLLGAVQTKNPEEKTTLLQILKESFKISGATSLVDASGQEKLDISSAEEECDTLTADEPGERWHAVEHPHMENVLLVLCRASKYFYEDIGGFAVDSSSDQQVRAQLSPQLLVWTHYSVVDPQHLLLSPVVRLGNVDDAKPLHHEKNEKRTPKEAPAHQSDSTGVLAIGLPPMFSRCGEYFMGFGVPATESPSAKKKKSHFQLLSPSFTASWHLLSTRGIFVPANVTEKSRFTPSTQLRMRSEWGRTLSVDLVTKRSVLLQVLRNSLK